MAEGNKNQWVIWTIVLGAIIITFVAFNYQGDKNEVIPLSEIFPDEGLDGYVEAEYEYVDAKVKERVDIPQGREIITPIADTASARTPQTSSPAVEPEQLMQTTGPYYTIQALSSKNKISTEKALGKAKKRGHASAFMATQSVEGRGTWYRIYIGKFESKQQADAYLPAARKDYKDCFVKLVKK